MPESSGANVLSSLSILVQLVNQTVNGAPNAKSDGNNRDKNNKQMQRKNQLSAGRSQSPFQTSMFPIVLNKIESTK